MSISERLKARGIELPRPAAPVASYQPVVIHGGMAYVSGQLPFLNGELVTGRLGDDVGLDRGVEAARACGLMILAQLEAALGSLDRVERVIKLGGFVNSTADFTDQPKVVNGASDFLVEALGDKGRHARSAVGVAGLPFGVAVEVEAIFEVA